MTVATAGRAVFFSRPDRAPGPARPGPVRVHDPALGGHGRGDRGRPRGVRGAHPAARRSSRSSAPGSTALGVRPVRADAGADGAWARLARRVMRHPVAVLVPTLSLLLVLGLPFLHVRFNAPDATILPPRRPVPGDLRHPRRASSARASSRRSCSRSARRATPRRPERRDALRLLAAARRGPAGPPRRSLVDVDPRLTLAQYQLLYGSPRPAGPVRRDRARRHDEGRPHRAHRVHAVRPQPRARAGRSSRDLRDPASPLAPPAGVSRARRWRRGGRRRRRRRGSGRTSRAPRCSSS